MSNFKPFDEMVSNLFKVRDFNDSAAGLMHAAIGISGEVVELAWADSRENFIEEAGDLEFYCCAAIQEMRLAPEQHARLLAIVEVYISERVNGRFNTDDILKALMQFAGLYLDLAKKQWVYSKPANTVVDAMVGHLGHILGGLILLYNVHRISRQEVIDANQTKLGIRYPAGVYSNEHANERKDKA